MNTRSIERIGAGSVVGTGAVIATDCSTQSRQTHNVGDDHDNE